MFSRRAGIGAVLAAALMGSLSAGALAQPTPTVQSIPAKAKRRGLFDTGLVLAPLRPWAYSGPGTTMAQQQRASRKAKNVKRHRAAGRG